MRFSHTIRVNANPFWWRYYIPYEDLKKSIVILQYLRFTDFSSVNDRDNTPVDESTDDEAPTSPRSTSTIGSPSPEHVSPKDNVPLIQRTSSDLRRTASQRVLHALSRPGATHADEHDAFDDTLPRLPAVTSVADAAAQFAREEDRFMRRLRLRASRAEDFFVRLRDELLKTSKSLRDKVTWMHDTRRRTAEEETPLVVISHPSEDLVSESDFANFKRDCISNYREITEAITFSVMNVTAYRKILKKHDKRTGLRTLNGMMEELDLNSELRNTSSLEQLKEEVVDLFAEVFMNFDKHAAKEELDQHLRDLILYERTSLWSTSVADVPASSRAVRGYENFREQQEQPVKLTVNWYVIVVALLAYAFIRIFPGFLRAIIGQKGIESSPEAIFMAANRCFALVVLAVVLWAAVGIPLYATSFVVLVGCVVGNVFVDSEGVSLSPVDACDKVFRHLGSPTLLLILSVYAMAAALSKFEIDRQVATYVLRGNLRANAVLAKLMILSVVVSGIVSNVAAPVLLNSVMKPTFDIMDASKAPRRYIRCLLIGIMVASNVGGFATSIASPQSAVALGILEDAKPVNGLQWLIIAVPICIAMVLMFFIVLQILFRPHEYILPELQPSQLKYRWWHIGIIATLCGTTIVWLAPQSKSIFGTSGMEATLPLIALFGFGILTKGDFNSLPWDVVILVAGGSVLGTAVESSRLLHLLSHRLSSLSGGSTWGTFAGLCAVVAVLSSFVSHTVSAIILLPLFLEIGTELGQGRIFVLGGTIAASCAMATNISSFPNISAAEIQDRAKNPFLESWRIGQIGSGMTFVALVVLIFLGYPWMLMTMQNMALTP